MVSHRNGHKGISRTRSHAVVVRLLVVSVVPLTAAATLVAPAHADPAGNSILNALNNAGGGSGGPASTFITGLGQKVCPMLVQPGSTLATAASRMRGNTGMSPDITGFFTGIAIQMACPAMVSSLANGNMPIPLQLPGAGGNMPMPLQLPGR